MALQLDVGSFAGRQGEEIIDPWRDAGRQRGWVHDIEILYAPHQAAEGGLGGLETILRSLLLLFGSRQLKLGALPLKLGEHAGLFALFRELQVAGGTFRLRARDIDHPLGGRHLVIDPGHGKRDRCARLLQAEAGHVDTRVGVLQQGYGTA
jgi:hypothetical protein